MPEIHSGIPTGDASQSQTSPSSVKGAANTGGLTEQKSTLESANLINTFADTAQHDVVIDPPENMTQAQPFNDDVFYKAEKETEYDIIEILSYDPEFQEMRRKKGKKTDDFDEILVELLAEMFSRKMRKRSAISLTRKGYSQAQLRDKGELQDIYENLDDVNKLIEEKYSGLSILQDLSLLHRKTHILKDYGSRLSKIINTLHAGSMIAGNFLLTSQFQNATVTQTVVDLLEEQNLTVYDLHLIPAIFNGLTLFRFANEQESLPEAIIHEVLENDFPKALAVLFPKNQLAQKLGSLYGHLLLNKNSNSEHSLPEIHDIDEDLIQEIVDSLKNTCIKDLLDLNLLQSTLESQDHPIPEIRI